MWVDVDWQGGGHASQNPVAHHMHRATFRRQQLSLLILENLDV